MVRPGLHHGLAECPDPSLGGIDGKILLMRSEGGERVLYPDGGRN